MQAEEKSTRVRAIAEAKSLIQTYGYEGFSFQHVADALKIRKPSLYSHFESKEDLGIEVVKDAAQVFADRFQIREDADPEERLEQLFSFLCDISADGKLCALSALASDFQSLPKKIQSELAKLYKIEHDWIRTTISSGQKRKQFRVDKSPAALADLFLSIAFGAQTCARVLKEPKKILHLRTQAIALLRA